MAGYFDRYNKFRLNNEVKPLPGVSIPVSNNDKYVIYKKGVTRLDNLSDKYYLNAYSGWLILLANQEYGGLEFNIPDGVSIRIPFPYEDAISRYNTQISKDLNING